MSRGLLRGLLPVRGSQTDWLRAWTDRRHRCRSLCAPHPTSYITFQFCYFRKRRPRRSPLPDLPPLPPPPVPLPSRFFPVSVSVCRAPAFIYFVRDCKTKLASVFLTLECRDRNGVWGRPKTKWCWGKIYDLKVKWISLVFLFVVFMFY